MIEAIVSASIAVIAAGAALNNRTHTLINDMEKRIDQVELRIATDYVPKEDFTAAISKMEDHMIRIENKIDQIVMKNG
jgi:hypothetical protein